MWLESVGSTATVPIARLFEMATLDASSVQVAPPSVDLYRPTPASESPAPFGSPVPTQIVFGLLGSIAIEPIALDAGPFHASVHAGVAARASVVFQMPPPAAPPYSTQLPETQVGAIAIAATRPETFDGRPV